MDLEEQHESPAQNSTVDGSSQKSSRSSRKDQPRRFACHCGKKYSRAEHLARHQLNHAPKEILRCGVSGCRQTFVRADLLDRHRRRHISNPSLMRRESQATGFRAVNHKTNAPPTVSPLDTASHSSEFPAAPSLLHDVSRSESSTSVLDQYSIHQLTPNTVTSHSTLHYPGNMIEPSTKVQYGPLVSTPAPVPPQTAPASDVSNAKDGFANWLFDSEDFSVDMEFGNFADWGLETAFNLDKLYSDMDLPLIFPPILDSVSEFSIISDFKRGELLDIIRNFKKKEKQEDQMDHEMTMTEDTLPFQSFVSAFWTHVSPQIPIIHQPTFTSHNCPILLLAMIIALGARTLHKRSHPGESPPGYAALADLLASGLRWELFTHKDASPPAQIWVFQALLLLELYEKMFSSRHLHERAHVHHLSLLTLLRRGSPLIGKDGRDSPPLLQPTDTGHLGETTLQAWWKGWVERESILRVVFTFFTLDILHATLFGHEAGISDIQEIQLNLPCDDALWSAPNAQTVQTLDASLNMYGVNKPMNFLQTLRKLLHGHDIKTHSFARLILLCGLLSVNRQMLKSERQFQWIEVQEGWRTMMMSSFDHWNAFFDDALGNSNIIASHSLETRNMMYHLAHMQMDIDVIAFQILGGATRVLGRQIGVRDRATAISRIKIWRSTTTARHAVLHAFRLLKKVLLTSDTPPKLQYSCRLDTLVHRPFVLYTAGLTIWAYVYSSRTSTFVPPVQNATSACVEYITMFAAVENADELAKLAPQRGICALLEVLNGLLSQTDWQILAEGAARLEACRQLLLTDSAAL